MGTKYPAPLWGAGDVPMLFREGRQDFFHLSLGVFPILPTRY